MLRTKGDIRERIFRLNLLQSTNKSIRAQLSENEAAEAQVRQDIAEDCHNRYILYKRWCQYDSAGYYIELYAGLDTTNVEGQLESGPFFKDFCANYVKSGFYSNRTIRQAMRQYGANHPLTGRCYMLLGDLNDANSDSARRADGGVAGALAGLAQPHRALPAPFGTVTMPCSPDQVAIVQSGTIKHK